MIQNQHDISVTSVSVNDWADAQKYEKETWFINNKRNSFAKLVYKFFKALAKPKEFLRLLYFRDFYCGNDWNFWWLDQFESYQVLPKFLETSLEIGCGPYSNTRIISKLIKIKNIYCSDPLMDVYKTFKLTWVSEQARRGKIKTITGMGESVALPDKSVDLVICVNVLDHVQDASLCLSEVFRVLKPGGFFVFGQDLSDEKDLANLPISQGHPIRLSEQFLDSILENKYTPLLKKILSREQGRNPEGHCGTYILIGKK